MLSDKLVDGDIETYYDSSASACYVGWDFGANYKAQINSLRYFLKIGAVFTNFLGTKIETSNDGTTWTEIYESNEVMTDGWNFW